MTYGTKGTLRKMRKPTNLDELYPDPFHGLDAITDKRVDRWIHIASWLAAFAFVGWLAWYTVPYWGMFLL